MKIWILESPIGSGKTTRLRHWAPQQSSARGILSPIVEGRRSFLHLPDGEICEMEAGPLESSAYATPRYRFSVAAFQWAEQRLNEDIQLHPEWLLVDEIGKLELRGMGFAGFLENVLGEESVMNLLLVVRSELVAEVQKRFGIQQALRWKE